jgi:hypothetical protein
VHRSKRRERERDRQTKRLIRKTNKKMIRYIHKERIISWAYVRRKIDGPCMLHSSIDVRYSFLSF